MHASFGFHHWTLLVGKFMRLFQMLTFCFHFNFVKKQSSNYVFYLVLISWSKQWSLIVFIFIVYRFRFLRPIPFMKRKMNTNRWRLLELLAKYETAWILWNLVSEIWLCFSSFPSKMFDLSSDYRSNTIWLTLELKNKYNQKKVIESPPPIESGTAWITVPLVHFY